MTPADELRELLGRVEKRLANLRGSGQGAVELLLDLDRIAELWPELEAQGVDLRPEAGRWDTIQAQLRRSGPRVLRELWAAGGLDQVRAQQHATADGLAWWWQLDSLVRQESIARVRRTLVTLGVVAAVVVGAWLLLHTLFPVDPQVQAALAAQTAGEQKIVNYGDYAGALADFETAAQHTPDDPDMWIRVGAVQEKLGDAQAAQANYARARQLSASERAFHLARAGIYLSFLMYDEAHADVQAVLAEEPRNAVAWYYLGSVYEGQGKLELAVDALEKTSEYADESNQTELVALARYRMAMLLQQVGLGDMREPEPTPTATPGA
ncbi:MAG: Tetratricopeptide repeat protein [Chloroflexi bacterium ADurb.Bin325]|nr:MAG: Tetratricopeptide repeat protein [Chloroflexi bacterium ADurb.Bin325]